MRAFVVLGLVFSISKQEIGLGKRLRNDLFSVGWDVKPQLSQSVNQPSGISLLIRVQCIDLNSCHTDYGKILLLMKKKLANSSLLGKWRVQLM